MLTVNLVSILFAGLTQPGFFSMLDDSGEMIRRLAPGEAQSWISEVGKGKIAKDRAIQLRIWLAEVDLALNEEPMRAARAFTKIIPLTRPKTAMNGIARRGLALAEFISGRYALSAKLFADLQKNPSPGYFPKAISMLRRHAEMCASYHAARSKAGITEPTHIDPLCGVAAIAIGLKHFGLPHDKPSVSKSVYHTGKGSNMANLVAGYARFGLNSYPINVKRDGLIKLFSVNGGAPLVAHVERDHFIAVTGADTNGVTYWCSDCGEWPGGERKLTWNQWEMMDTDAYLAMAIPGTAYDAALKAKLDSPQCLQNLELAKSLLATIGGDENISPIEETIAESVTPLLLPLDLIICGVMPQVYSPPCPHECPMDVPQLEAVTVSEVAPSRGDPVNLATGSESYAPPPELVVYNPKGPQVAWGHRYDSHAMTMPNGFGMGWSHPYLFIIDTLRSAPDSNPPVFIESTTAYFNYPDSARFSFTLPSSFPTGSTGVLCGGSNHPHLIYMHYNTGTSKYYFTVKSADHSIRTFEKLSNSSANERDQYYLTKIEDRNGNYITLHWSSTIKAIQMQNKHFYYQGGSTSDFARAHLLETIKDNSTTPQTLLSLSYDNPEGYWRITAASDIYGRSVYYDVSDEWANSNMQSGAWGGNDELKKVSPVVPTGTSSPPVRFEYDYILRGNLETGQNSPPGYQQVPYLNKIITPQSHGSGTSTATIDYDSLGYVTKVTDANGNKREYDLTTANEAVVEVRNSSNTLIKKYSLEFDGFMNWTKLYDANDNLVVHRSGFSTSGSPYRPNNIKVYSDGTTYRDWDFSYDGYSRLLTVNSPKNVLTTYTYDDTNFDLGELTEIYTYYSTGENILSTQIEYHTNGLVKKVKTPMPGSATPTTRETTEYSYNSLGDITQVIEPGVSGTRTWNVSYTSDGSYSQDAKVGQPIKVTDPNGKVWHARYDTRGNLTKVWDPVGSESTNYSSAEYDLSDRLIKTESPPTGTTGNGRSRVEYVYPYSATYSGNTTQWGPVIEVKAFDENNTQVRKKFFTFGLEGEPLKTTTLVGSTQEVESEVTYDADYNIKTFKDGLAQTTTYFYNTNGLPTEVRYPGWTSGDADRAQYTSYDRAGRLLAMTDGRGVEWEYGYEDASGLCTEVVSPLFNISYAFDEYDRLTELSDALGGETYAYDDLGLLLSKTRSYTGLDDQETEFTYFDDGSRSTAVGPMGTYTYYYDDNYRLNKFTSDAGQVLYEYFDDGSMSKRSVKNTSNTLIAETSYAYNEVGALESLTNKDGSSNTRSSFGSFTFDGVFNLTGLSRTITGVSGHSGTAAWAYDPQDRLTSDATPGFSATTFAYDDAYNPTTMRGTSGLSYNSNNQRSATGYTYDGNGNPTTYKTDSCWYDNANRLTVYEPYHTGTNSYINVGYNYCGDGLMGQREKYVYVYSGNTWVSVDSSPTHIYNLDGHPCYETDGESENYNVFAPDGLVARKQNGSWIYYQFDQQGNVAQRLNSSGTVLNSSSYDAYGAETFNGTNQNDCFGYNGQWGYILDRDVGLYYCQNRWYDPSTGRWLNRDPIGYGGGANLYGYCDNSPVIWIDIAGHQKGKPRKAIIITGERYKENASDIDGAFPYFDDLANLYRDKLKGMGYSVTILDRPNETQVRKAVKGADAVVGIFHGNASSNYGRLQGEPTRYASQKLTPALIEKSRKGRPLRMLVLESCNLTNAGNAPPWLAVADVLYGYDGPGDVARRYSDWGKKGGYGPKRVGGRQRP